MTLNAFFFLISKIRQGKKGGKITDIGVTLILYYCLGLLDEGNSVSRTENFLYSLTVKFLHYFFIMPVGFDLNITYGLKSQVNCIKIATFYRRSIFQVESHYTTRSAPRFVCSTKLSPVQWSSYLDG